MLVVPRRPTQLLCQGTASHWFLREHLPQDGACGQTMQGQEEAGR